MAVAFRSTNGIVATEFTVATQSPVINKPSGAADGDLMLMFVVTSTTTNTASPVANWTRVTTEVDAGSVATVACYYRIHSGDGSSWTMTNLFDSTETGLAVVACYTGVNLKILATSREALGVMGEFAYRVPAFGMPDMQGFLEDIRTYESVRLFEERAQLAQSDFSLTQTNASFVAQICSRLDGLPLAIELAAAQVVIFSTDQIAARLNESFNLLTGGSRTVLPRQQTIRASIDWSWNLISKAERILLRRLAVFSGGWTLEAAEAICQGNGIEQHHQVVELMSRLAAKSLVNAHQAPGSAKRFYLHEAIREYAHEKLVESGESETLRDKHLE